MRILDGLERYELWLIAEKLKYLGHFPRILMVIENKFDITKSFCCEVAEKWPNLDEKGLS